MSRWLLALALLVQLSLSVGYALHTPAFEGPDENDHAYYACFVAQRRALPLVLGSAQQAGATDWEQAVLGHHPPLYYALLATMLHALGAADTVPSWRGNPDNILQGGAGSPLHWQHGHDEVAPVSEEIWTLRILRLLSVFCGVASVGLTYALARCVLPDCPTAAGIAALLLACLPQWSFAHGVLDNGNLATTLCTATLVLLARALARPASRPRLGLGTATALGLSCGLAVITKLTALFCVPLVAVAFVWLLWTAPAQRRAHALGAVCCAGAFTAVAGWFFARNAMLYDDPLATAAHRAAFASNAVPDGMRWQWLGGNFAPLLGESFVGNLGWVSHPVPAPAHFAFAAAAALAAIGWLLRGRRLTPRRTPLVLSVAAVGLVFAQVVRFNIDFFQPQGRYLFPGAGALAVLVGGGVAAAGTLLPRRWTTAIGLTTAAMLPLGAAAILCFDFAPAFAVVPGDVERERASMIRGLATPPPDHRATITLVEPADGAELVDAPTLRWRAADGSAPGGRYTVHLYTDAGRVLFGTYEWASLAFTEQRMTFSDAHWALIPTDLELSWKVRRLPDRAAGEGVDDAAESPPRRFTRRRR